MRHSDYPNLLCWLVSKRLLITKRQYRSKNFIRIILRALQYLYICTTRQNLTLFKEPKIYAL